MLIIFLDKGINVFRYMLGLEEIDFFQVQVVIGKLVKKK